MEPVPYYQVSLDAVVCSLQRRLGNPRAGTALLDHRCTRSQTGAGEYRPTGAQLDLPVCRRRHELDRDVFDGMVYRGLDSTQSIHTLRTRHIRNDVRADCGTGGCARDSLARVLLALSSPHIRAGIVHTWWSKHVGFPGIQAVTVPMTKNYIGCHRITVFLAVAFGSFSARCEAVDRPLASQSGSKLPTMEEMIEARTDVWGDAAMRQPNGASYEFFKDLLPPVRWANAE